MRAVLLWILILHTLHLPVPFPDLDGECLGAPIHSLSEGHAWHVLILGVRPNDDIDRGPFRTDDQDDETSPACPPYGDSGLSLTSASTLIRTLCEASESMVDGDYELPYVSAAGPVRDPQPRADDARTHAARTFRSLCCVWLI